MRGPRGFTTTRLPVSHAFHTSIVAPASEPLRRTLQRIELRPPTAPGDLQRHRRLLPVRARSLCPRCSTCSHGRWRRRCSSSKACDTLYDEGARVFVEVGPKWALRGFVVDVLGDEAAVNLATNHPKAGDVVSFNQALCGLYAAGLGFTGASEDLRLPTTTTERSVAATPAHNETRPRSATDAPTPDLPEQTYAEMGRLLADFLDRVVPFTRPAAARRRRPPPAPRPSSSPERRSAPRVRPVSSTTPTWPGCSTANSSST